jgi:DNA-binding NarL/FixJ family response regulator
MNRLDGNQGSMTNMCKKTVLVASRHPHLEDVRKRILEEAGYQVISIRSPEEIEEACRNHKLDLVLIGYSLTQAEKRRIAAEAISCKCPVLELWDREPPRRREDQHPIADHFSLRPDDFLDAVNDILGRNDSK